MKSIVVFINTLLSGGAEKQALLLATTLKHNYRVMLVVYYGEKVEAKFQTIIDTNAISVVYLKGNHFTRILTFYRLLKKNKISFIFSYLLTTNLIGSFIGMLAGVSIRAGGIRNAELDKRKLPVQRFINNHLSTHTIFNNYDGLNALEKKGFKTKNALVIPNCFELTTTPITRELPTIPQIITVGRFVYQKGYFNALEIMSLLKNDGEKFKYTIVGFGELENDIRKKILELNLSHCVEVVINPPNIADYYKKTDVYLCTSFFEGLSNTIMEALSFSQPVVATSVGDNARLVHHGVNGFIIPQNQPKFFIEPLKKLISSNQLRNEMGLKSYQIIRDEYSGAAFKAHYENFINKFN